jgi:hypothetical protein
MLHRTTILLSLASVCISYSLPAQENRSLARISGADTTQYSREYLEELRSSGIVSSITLVDSMMVVDGRTVLFPTNLEAHRWYAFNANSEKGLVELRLMRLNYTKIRYELWIGSGEKSKEDDGFVIGGPGILGTENDTDDRSHTQYFVTEYSACSLHCCRSIRIGRNDADELVAKFIRHCDQRGMDIGLDNLPTLRLP